MTDNELQDPPKTATTESLETTSKPGEDASTNATEETDSDSTLAPVMGSDEANDGDQDNGQDDGNAETEKSEDNNNNNNDNNNNEDGAKEDTRTEEERRKAEEAEIKRIEETIKKDYKDWPQKDIKEPHAHDVLYGRGGGTNHHPGNKRYRKMVEDKKVEYVNSRRLDKPLVAYGILRKWRAQLPPGRFLKLNDKTGLWNDVGDKAAREKTSQALREKAPQIRKQQEEEQNGASGVSETGSDEDRKPAAKGKKKGKPKKAILQREHTLGETFLGSGENMDISGFTWCKDESNRSLSTGSINSAQGTVLPPGRSSSRGSAGMPFSSGFNPPYPPPPDYHGRVFSGEQRRELSNSSIGTFYSVPGSAPFNSGAQPPLPPPNAASMHHRSDSWNFQEQTPSPRHGPHHQRTGSWNGNGDMRSHSLSGYPLAGATVNEPVTYWSQSTHPPGAYGRYSSDGSMGPMGSMGQPSPPPQPPPPPPPPYRQIASPSHSNTSSPPSNAMDYERPWNAGGGSTPPPPPRDFAYEQYDAYPPTAVGADSSPPRRPEYRPIARPGMIKRDTSNQNETYESKPNRVKRAALNRDQSATSNRLKQEYIPEVFHQDMQSLQQTTEQIRLSSPEHDRSLVDPFDANSAGTGTNPMPLPLGDRRTTSQELVSELLGEGSDDGVYHTNALNDLPPARPQPLQPLPRPAPWNESNRMTTAEFLNAPLGDDDDLRDDEHLTQI